MTLLAVCQCCGKSKYDWIVRQAEVSVGALLHWKVQLCEDCTKDLEAAIRKVLLPPTGEK